MSNELFATDRLEFFVTCPLGLEPALVTELQSLIDRPLKHGSGGTGFHGTLEHFYKVYLWSRVANRIMIVLHRGRLREQRDLYQQVHDLPWEQHFTPAQNFMVRCTGKPEVVNNTHFAALLAKDAVVDRFRERSGERPSVVTDDPDYTITVHFGRNNCAVYLDMCGAGLHKRGYRAHSTEAPLRENIAAALLIMNDWPRIAAAGGGFLDPMCGSGTIVIEAALMAARIAPGLGRVRHSLTLWRGHDRECWEQALEAARSAGVAGRAAHGGALIAGDRERKALQAARDNAANAGVETLITFTAMDVSAGLPADVAQLTPGLLVTNPPYGKRLSVAADLQTLYYALGRMISALPGWRAAVLLEDGNLVRAMRLTPESLSEVKNGPITCQLASFEVAAEQQMLPDLETVAGTVDENAQAFVNRVRKNRKHLEKWARREGIGCYRVYDKDLPEFALAVDVYDTVAHGVWLHVQEYEAPKGVDPVKARLRLTAACDLLPEVFAIPKNQVVLKTRRRQTDAGQYERRYDSYDQRGGYIVVREGPGVLLANLSDYLDTGIFLDSRDIRAMIRQQAPAKRFLNLFCYTATASVQAALGGAAATTSVDMSNTYLEWARQNFLANDLPLTHHALLKADCLQWLAQQNAIAPAQRTRYDIILLDPPTVSRSKGMDSMLDVQRDHVQLIYDAMRLLADGGVLYFCTNYRRFKLDHEALLKFTITDISHRTLPQDFARNKKIHQCWQFVRKEQS